MKYLLSIILSTILFGCINSNYPSQKAAIARLDLAIENYNAMPKDQQSLICDSFSTAINALKIALNTSEPSDSLLLQLSLSQGVKIFTPDIRNVFKSLDSIENIIGIAKYNMMHTIPQLQFPQLYGIVSTYNQSIIMVDSIMFIGLNHYLGCEYPGYSNFEKYQRATKTPKHLPYDVVEAIIRNQFPYQSSSDETTINRLLYEGAVAVTTAKIIPDASIPETLGYSSDQFHWLSDNESQMWKALITRLLLYSSDPIVAERLIRPSPATTILHPEAPGRAGRYIGVSIVESYLSKYPNTDFSFLLSSDFYNAPSTLVNSGYNP